MFENTWQNQKIPFTKERNRQFQRSRTSESWEDEGNVPIITVGICCCRH